VASRSPASKVGRFRALAGEEKLLRIEAWWRLLGTDIALRLRRRAPLERALVDPGPGSEEGGDAVARAVASAAAHHLWRMTCLPRALVLWRMLAARGVAARVRIGVRRESGTIRAHAWVEAGGRPLAEPERVDERFLPLIEAD
jgi:hypothetical protein